MNMLFIDGNHGTRPLGFLVRVLPEGAVGRGPVPVCVLYMVK